MQQWMHRGVSVSVLAWLLVLAGCGGGGGGGADGATTNTGASSFGPAGTATSFAQQCAANNSMADASKRTGSLATEKKWVRAYFDENYLWRDEVPAVDPAGAAYSGSDVFAALDAYFEALKTPKLTTSGAKKDRFSFTLSTAEWEALSQRGEEAGYGIAWSMASSTPPRQIRVAYVEPGSPAALADIRRGDSLVSVNGVSSDAPDQAGVTQLNEGLYPSQAGVSRALVFRRDGQQFSASLSSANVAMTPVPLYKVQTLANGNRAGYLLFNDHNLPSEALLIKAMQEFQQQDLKELVLDLRYNGGGYVFVASELAYMIAGSAKTAGVTFEASQYNAKRVGQNTLVPFYDTACIAANGACTANSQKLPSLNLQRVYVLTTSSTCSASEAIINGLRGANVEVVQIGGATCGKPYGFNPKDNCGISYFPIEFSGVNAKGFGDYADGFEPGVGASARFLPGCKATDDMSHALGDSSEALLSAALTHAATGQCPPATAQGVVQTRRPLATANAYPLEMRRQPARENRIGGVR